MYLNLGLGINNLLKKRTIEKFDIEKPRGADLFTLRFKQNFVENNVFGASRIEKTRTSKLLDTSRMELSENTLGKINNMIENSVASAETRLMNTFAQLNVTMLDIKKNTNEAIKETRYANYHARHNSKAHSKILIILNVEQENLGEDGKQKTDYDVAIEMIEKSMEGVDLGGFRITRAIITKVTREKFYKFENTRPNARKPLYPDKDKLKVTFIHERDRDFIHNVVYNINGHKNFFKDMSKDDRYYFNFTYWAVDKLNDDPKGTHWYTVANNAILETRPRQNGEKRKPRPEGKNPPRNPGIFSYGFPWQAAQNFGSGAGNEEQNDVNIDQSQVFRPQMQQHPSQHVGLAATPGRRGALQGLRFPQDPIAARDAGRAAANEFNRKLNEISPNSMVSSQATSTPRHVSKHMNANAFKTFHNKRKGKGKTRARNTSPKAPKAGKRPVKRKKDSPSGSPTQTMPPNNKKSNIDLELELSVQCLEDPKDMKDDGIEDIADDIAPKNIDENNSGSSLYDTADEDSEIEANYKSDDASEHEQSSEEFNGFGEFAFNSSLMNTTIKQKTPFKDPYDQSIDSELMKTIVGENRPIEGENPLTAQEAYDIILEKHAEFQDADLNEKNIILFEMASDIQILHFLVLSHKDDKETFGRMLEWCQETLGFLSINCSAIGINSTGITATDIEEKCRLILEGKQIPLLTSIKPAKYNIVLARKKHMAKVEQEIKNRSEKRGILNGMLECSMKDA